MLHGSVYMLLCWVTVMPVLISCSRVADVSMKASAKPLPQHLQAPIVAACVGLGESQEHLMGPCFISCVAHISVPNASLQPLALHVVTASHLGTWRKRRQRTILFDTKVINSTQTVVVVAVLELSGDRHCTMLALLLLCGWCISVTLQHIWRQLKVDATMGHRIMSKCLASIHYVVTHGNMTAPTNMLFVKI
jgi:hypothetical protein